MPYDPGDVVEVIRGPRQNAAAGTYRAFAATLKGLKMTFGRLVEGPMTTSYPEEKMPVYPRFRGRHKLHRFEDTGLEKCVGCSLCAAACPADCIRVVAAEYLNVTVVSGLIVTLFFGGWNLPWLSPPTWVDPIIVIVKMLLMVVFFIWVRATLPRLRYDQLMSLGWKILLPLATLNALVTAILVVVT